ncbi:MULTISPECIES: hypothetical protein [unclassified Bradyrhizobium]|uniref:hypothetical protein n=1 Tax=unclassified Bradyrhizobium TaxID=2631580 RepID=UPI002915D26C|nr:MULTISPECIES: hypothetical protein [unclassified Bradyrhizobium]
MKLNDFSAVAELIKERAYLTGLACVTRGSLPRVRIEGNDIRPDLAGRMLPDMRLVLEQQIGIVDEKLAALGVTNDREAA